MSEHIRKIAVVVNIFPKLSETFILSQIVGLIDRGFDVEIWARTRSDERLVHADIEKYELLAKTRYLSVPLMPHDDSDEWCREFKHLNEGINIEDIDLFHVHFGINFNVLKPFFVNISSPIIVSFHGLDASQYIKQAGNGCYKELFDRATLITTPSHEMKSVLEEKGCVPDAICVHRYGVDLTCFRPMLRKGPSDVVTILTVARLVEKKGIDDALKAFAAIRSETVRYRIVGEGPLENRLKQLAIDLGITERVQFLGALPKSGVLIEMQQADIYVLTSRTAVDGDKEGLPVTLIEAHAVGLPVVSTYSAGIPDLVVDGETGFLSAEGDVKNMKQHLRTLVADHDLRVAMGLKARRRVEEEFDIEQLNDRLCELYHLAPRGVIH